MTRSTDTCARPAVSCRDMRDGFEHRLRAAGIDHDVAGPRLLQLAFEWHGDASALAGAAVFGGQDQRDAPRREPIQIETARAPRSRAVEQRRRRAARASASVSVANGARPTPPATIHACAGGSTGSNGLPSGPRHETTSPSTASNSMRVVTPTRLLSSVRPVDAAVVAQNLEHRERPAQQRIAAAAGLDHDELAWQRPRRRSQEQRGR